MILAQEKVVTCCVALVGYIERRDTLVMTSATRTTRVQRVDMSTSLFPEVVPEIDANSKNKRLNLYT